MPAFQNSIKDDDDDGVDVDVNELAISDCECALTNSFK